MVPVRLTGIISFCMDRVVHTSSFGTVKSPQDAAVALFNQVDTPLRCYSAGPVLDNITPQRRRFRVRLVAHIEHEV